MTSSKAAPLLAAPLLHLTLQPAVGMGQCWSITSAVLSQCTKPACSAMGNCMGNWHWSCCKAVGPTPRKQRVPISCIPFALLVFPKLSLRFACALISTEAEIQQIINKLQTNHPANRKGMDAKIKGRKMPDLRLSAAFQKGGISIIQQLSCPTRLSHQGPTFGNLIPSIHIQASRHAQLPNPPPQFTVTNNCALRLKPNHTSVFKAQLPKKEKKKATPKASGHFFKVQS